MEKEKEEEVLSFLFILLFNMVRVRPIIINQFINLNEIISVYFYFPLVIQANDIKVSFLLFFHFAISNAITETKKLILNFPFISFSKCILHNL